MSECNHDCASCASKKEGACGGEQDFRAKANEGSNVRKVVAVMSGKGGVGKSLVTELLAVCAAKRGLKVGVLDADVTGPSIPTAFGVTDKAQTDGTSLFPIESSKLKVKVMSINLLVENPNDPVVWRGPVLAGVVKQFWSDVAWGDLDVMFVDMPPGTGDVPLTVFQSLPVDAAVVVTSPQDLVAMIVGKAVRMADMMKIPVKGLVENMASFRCPDCGKVHRIFGEGNGEVTAGTYGIPEYVSLPIDPALAASVDAGKVEEVDASALNTILDAVLSSAKPAESK